MLNKVLIVPTVLVSDKKAVEKKLKRLRGMVKRVQVDMADGRFTSAKTVGLDELRDIKSLKDFEIEAHLMVAEPIGWLGKCKQLGTNRVVGHIETMSSQQRFIETAWDLGLKPGLALKLETEVEEIEPGMLTAADQILLLAVKAGFSGQPFDKRVLTKIRRARELAGEEQEICVDGGIDDKTARSVVAAGADVLAVGSFLWQGEIGEQIKKLEASFSAFHH